MGRQKPASAGFLLAVVLVSYVIDKINKSYQLDPTMKINEIATLHLDEAPPGVTPAVKYVGPYFDKAAAAAAKAFGASKGTTQAELDALRSAETGAANTAGGGRRSPTGERPLSTVSSDELNALLYPPRAAEPTVASWLKRRGDPGFDPDLSKTQALPGYLQNLPPARIGPVTAPRPSASGPHPRNATPNLGNVEPELGLDTTASREIGQVRPGAETAATAAADSTAAGVPRYTMDEIRQFQELLRTNPAAAEETAKKMGLPAKLFLGAAGVGALAATPTAINAVRPGTVPDWANPVSYATKGAEKVLAPQPLSTELQQKYPEVHETPPEANSSSDSSSEVPADVQGDANAAAKAAQEKEAAIQELLKENEVTAALDRMIYLSRL